MGKEIKEQQYRKQPSRGDAYFSQRDLLQSSLSYLQVEEKDWDGKGSTRGAIHNRRYRIFPCKTNPKMYQALSRGRVPLKRS